MKIQRTFLFLIIFLLSLGCSENKSSLNLIKSDLERFREGKITFMEINPELNFFKDKNSETFQEFLSKNSKFEFNYLLKIRFSNLQEEIIFKVISCDFGPDFGNPSQVFLNFKVGDKILVRISNGYKISESGRVFRYEGTTHLDKGAVHEANPHPTPYQIKGAGAFRKIIN